MSITTLATEFTLSTFFSVTIDGFDLGPFTKVSGLAAQIEVQEHEEGGNPFFTHKLGGRITYPNVVLSRPLSRLTDTVQDWLQGMAKVPMRSTARLAAMQPDGSRLATWVLQDVVPVRWTLQPFDATSMEMAAEEIELAHHGFIPGTGGGLI